MTSGSKAHRIIMIDKEISAKCGKLIELTGLFHFIYVHTK